MRFLFLKYGIQYALIVWAYLFWRSEHYLRGLVILNLLFIALFSAKLITVFGYTSNVGNLHYATAVAIQCLIAHRYGTEAALRTVSTAFFSMSAVAAMCFCLRLSCVPPLTAGDNEYTRAVMLLINQSIYAVAASMAAFAVSQHVLVYLWKSLRERRFFVREGNAGVEMPLWLRYFVTVIAVQLVDSAIFFSLLVTGRGVCVLEHAFVGFVLKTFAGFGLLSIFYVEHTMLGQSIKRFADYVHEKQTGDTDAEG